MINEEWTKKNEQGSTISEEWTMKNEQGSTISEDWTRINGQWRMNWYKHSIKGQGSPKGHAWAKQCIRLNIYAKCTWDSRNLHWHFSATKDRPKHGWTDRTQNQSYRTVCQTADLAEPPELGPGTLGPGGRLEWYLTTWAKPPRAKDTTNSASGSLWNKLKESQSATWKNQKSD